MRLLSIDFDYWMPEKIEWDFGHQEIPLMIDFIWHSRAANFLARDMDFRQEMSISLDEMHPSELGYALVGDLGCSFPRDSMAFAESHVSAHDWFKDVQDGELWHIDAHHDIWYGREDINCDNWVKHLVDEGKVRSVNLVYPRWRMEEKFDFDWNGKVEEVIARWRKKGVLFKKHYGLKSLPRGMRFDRTFMCRSGAWVPPWLDNLFIYAAMNLLMAGDQRRYTTYTRDNLDAFRREFSEEGAKRLSDVMKEQMSSIMASQK